MTNSEALVKVRGYLTDYLPLDDADEIDEIIEALEQTKLIPVSERLPETDGVYIVTRRLFDNQIDTEPYYMVDACYFDGSNTWHDDNRINHERSYLTDIIAWMPLPESYKEESKIEQALAYTDQDTLMSAT